MIDKEIIKIASNTENHGVLNNHTHSSKLKNAICGDEMKIYLIVKNDKIKNSWFENKMKYFSRRRNDFVLCWNDF